MFTKILIANRGEIAIRIIRACREMGIRTVAVYSEADRAALHVRFADEAHCIGPAPAARSYLNMGAILEAAARSGARAIHPGYGFLSENPAFASLCAEEGFVFIGPPAAAIQTLGSKTAARQLADTVGVPVVPGTNRNLTDEEAEDAARRFGLPVVIKAAAGGGGKGMRVVTNEADLASAVRTARSEAQSAFGDPAIYLERYLTAPRHVEMQILADTHGHVVYLGERECSVQRRHQKVIEEAPSPTVTPELRRRIGEMAVALARAGGYVNAGTMEFLLDQDRNVYFLEMNSRLQVEHPVTEQVTGIDLVKTQIRIAAGEPLPFGQEDIRIEGHAIECRVYAEDPFNNFIPSPGVIRRLREPAGPGVRVESGVHEGAEVSVFYDPMISKIITWGRDRDEAVRRMRRALAETVVQGIKTTIPFHRWVMAEPAFARGEVDTSYIDTRFAQRVEATAEADRDVAVIAAALHMYLGEAGAAGVPAEAAAPRPSAWRIAARRDMLRR